MMALTRHHVTRQQAPCGEVVDADDYEDRDDETLLTQEIDYACGCVSIRHDYHDGSVARKVIHHNGSVLKDELLTAE
jgi:hypothetical protein